MGIIITGRYWIVAPALQIMKWNLMADYDNGGDDDANFMLAGSSFSSGCYSSWESLGSLRSSRGRLLANAASGMLDMRWYWYAMLMRKIVALV